MPAVTDPRVLVGIETGGDAAVYQLSDELALVQTVDFITPVVDDPYAYGAIAAAHALSDIYAMGARPVLALSILGFPTRSLPIGMLGEILKGCGEKTVEAGASIIGGHSVDDNEPKCGLSVTGLVHPQRMITNSGARPGDALVLTKPIGTGIITAAIEQRIVGPEAEARVIALMASLNRQASEAMSAVGVDACTDVTGFGLLGHLRNMLDASEVGARIDLSSVPVMPDAWDLVHAGVVPEGTHNNHRFLRDEVLWNGISREAQLVLCDAQTSGGLLIAVAPEKTYTLIRTIAAAGGSAVEIGQVLEREAGLQVRE